MNRIIPILIGAAFVLIITSIASAGPSLQPNKLPFDIDIISVQSVDGQRFVCWNMTIPDEKVFYDCNQINNKLDDEKVIEYNTWRIYDKWNTTPKINVKLKDGNDCKKYSKKLGGWINEC